MKHLSSLRQKTAIVLVAVVQVLSLFAFTVPRVSAETLCQKSNGTTVPTGAASVTFVYNPELCIWENEYYTWDPATKVYDPKYDQTPVLNEDGTAWEYPEWHYSPAKGGYELRTISIPVPSQSKTLETATPPEDELKTIDIPAQPGVNGSSSKTTGETTVGNTGVNSSNNISGSGNNNVDIEITNNTSVVTYLDSSAVSGNASVLQNTNGGSATTGNATAIANYLTLLQSGWNPNNGALTTFSADLYGSFTGDLLFNPQSILNTGPSSINTIANNQAGDLTITVMDNASIENNINLEAISGDAIVSENTNAGDARTGDATVIANVINLINSSIDSMRSFIGNINIHGDLNGDLLLPEYIMAQLFSTGDGSYNSINNSNTVNANANISSNASITDNINLYAESGAATVSENTNAGDAISGNASTNVEHTNIIGASSSRPSGLLVFVNVLGNWIGFVHPGFMSVGNTGPDSTNTISNNNQTDIDTNVSQNYSITNNINGTAKSGDATVSRNTNAGSAITGNASAAANVVNIIDTNLNYEDWFGILFINVFGNWNGSFGTDTEAGNKPVPVAQGLGEGKGAGFDTPQVLSETEIISSGVAYVARRVAARTAASSGFGSTSGGGDTTAVSAAAAEALSASSDEPAQVSSSTGSASIRIWVPAAALVLLGAVYVARRQELEFIRSMISRVR